jgi:hypothetical protein
MNCAQTYKNARHPELGEGLMIELQMLNGYY